MKIVVSVNVSPNCIFYLLIVSSLSCNFNRFVVCFWSFMNIACRSTQNVARIKCFLRLYIVIKPLNKKNNKFFIMLKCNSINIHSNTLQLATGWPLCRWFWKFFSGFAKSPRVLRSSWILNECNLYCKIVKYCILSEVCMIKTAPQSTVSPQMWCIKSIKGWFTHPQICWQDFVK